MYLRFSLGLGLVCESMYVFQVPKNESKYEEEKRGKEERIDHTLNHSRIFS